MIKKCLICDKVFSTTQSKINAGRGKFCSRKCKGEWQKTNLIGENNPFWHGGINKVSTKCPICKNTFLTKKARIKVGRGKYCSRKCMWKGLSKTSSLLGLKGAKNYCWKGGVTPLRSKINNSVKYRQWRQSIFIRDAFTCQDCGQRGGDLEAHHIKPFSELIKEVKKYLPLFDLFSAAMLYSPLWDINNGITLCKKCHSKKKKGQ